MVTIPGLLVTEKKTRSLVESILKFLFFNKQER